MPMLGKYGRLGNQMFQYAVMYAIAKKNNLVVKLPIIKYTNNDKCETKIVKYFDNLIYSPLLPSDVCDVKYDETCFSYSPDIFNLVCSKGIQITGYFQSYKYFDNIKADILKQFEFTNSIITKCRNVINVLRANNLPIVGCHIRLGDLSNYDAYGPPNSLAYIHNAINTIKNKGIDNFTLLIFSDNIQQCKTLNIPHTGYITYSENHSEGEDLCLMTLCDHLIISNSTFSWWGAYLNTNNRTIISKSMKGTSWFFDHIVPENERNDLLPSNFIQLEDSLDLQAVNIINSTIYIPEKQINLYKLKLIRDIKIENVANMHDIYDFGILIPIYNRYNYVKYCFKSLQQSILNYKIIVLLFDDGSTDDNLLELMDSFTIPNITIIKILCNRLNLINQSATDINTIMPGSAYPLTLRFGTDILFRMNAQLVVHMDSDAIVSVDWLYQLNKLYHLIDDKIKVINGFNSNEHVIIKEYGNYYTKNMTGGLGIVFDKLTYNTRIKHHLNHHAYDWRVFDEMNKNSETIYCTKPSVIQHIGIKSSMVRGIDKVVQYKNNLISDPSLDQNTNIDKLDSFFNSDEDVITQERLNEMVAFLTELHSNQLLLNFPYSPDFKILGSFDLMAYNAKYNLFDSSKHSTYLSCSNSFGDMYYDTNILNTYVDRIFIINLTSRKDRWNRISNHLDSIGIHNYERFNAIQPAYNNGITDSDILEFINSCGKSGKQLLKNIDINTYNKLTFEYAKSLNRTSQTNFIKGSVGCKMSHVEIIKIAKQRNYNKILILEDDILFIKNYHIYFKQAVQDIINNKLDYDLLYLSTNNIKPYTHITDNLVRLEFALQTAGYIVPFKMYDYIINNALKFAEIDVFFARFVQSKNNSYSICPNIINQAPDFSDIENRIVNYTQNTRMFTTQKYDIVIVAHSKDKKTLLLLLDSIGKYIHNYNNIYLVAKDNFIGNDIKFINENNYPFSKADVIEILKTIKCPEFNYGWFYQQLLKLHTHIAIPNISTNFLILDADMVFVDFFRLFNDDNIPYFTTGTENNKYYFDHMNRLIPGLTKQINKSGISHHMIFNKNILNEIITNVELTHKTMFWKAFLNCVRFESDTNFSCASEYEIYFNYVLKFHKDKYDIRDIKWLNTSDNDLAKHKSDEYKYICLHDYLINDHKKYKIE